MPLKYYSNAREGVKNIRSAWLVSIWLLVVTGLMALCGLARLAGFVLVLALATLGLSIAGFVLELMGVNRAARDVEIFSSARTALIVGIVLSLICAFLPEGSVLRRLLELVGSVCSLIAAVCIIKGLIALARIYRRDDLIAAGQKLLRLVVILFIINTATDLLILLFFADDSNLLLPLLGTLIGLVLGIIRYVMTLRYLSSVLDMLSAPVPQ